MSDRTDVLVAGHLTVEPAHRDTYLAGSVEVVRSARAADGCLDFTMSADLIDPGRINIFERWASQSAVEAFRGNGPEGDTADAIQSGDVREFDVDRERRLL